MGSAIFRLAAKRLGYGGVFALCSICCSHCGLVVHYYHNYEGKTPESAPVNFAIDVEAKPSPGKTIPALIVLWLALREPPYDLTVEFTGPRRDLFAARLDSIEIEESDAAGKQNTRIPLYPPRNAWTTAESPEPSEPDWGVMFLGVWWPLPVPRYPLAWLRKQPSFVTASVGPILWKPRAQAVEYVTLRIGYTLRLRDGERSLASEVLLTRRTKLYITLGFLTV